MQARTVGVLLALASAVQSQLDFTSNGCVDPGNFDSCWSSATSAAQTCYTQNCNPSSSVCSGPDECYSSDQNCVGACTCVAYQSWINCALSYCWNRAYSCEYQNLVINSARGCTLTVKYPPYFPPPADAPGSCSCQIGEVYGLVRDSPSLATTCQNYIGELRNEGQLTESQGPEYQGACSCCAASHAESALTAVCPDTDPSGIPFFKWATALSSAASTLSSAKCTSDFADSLDCTAQPLNYTLPNNGQFYGPNNLPAAGSNPLSDSSGSITAPLSATITWALHSGGIPSTAVAATAAGSASPSSSASSSGSSGSGSSDSSSSDSSSPASATPASSATSAGGASAAPTVTNTGKSAASRSFCHPAMLWAAVAVSCMAHAQAAFWP